MTCSPSIVSMCRKGKSCEIKGNPGTEVKKQADCWKFEPSLATDKAVKSLFGGGISD